MTINGLITKENKADINKVISGGYCIGCGSCAVKNDLSDIYVNDYGLPQASLVNDSDKSNVCPFASKINEDNLGESLYSSSSVYDKRIGFYLKNYVGHVIESDFRENASSGGVTSWVLAELFNRGEIDGVIHVGKGKNEVFEYQVSETLAEIKSNAKSRYYPVHYNDAIDKIIGNGKRYAFVGVPCFIKSIRLLARENKDVADSIKYCIAIFCGHFKTKSFAEMIAMQQGVSPKKLVSIDFRVKNKNKPANKYSSQIIFRNDDKNLEKLPEISNQKIYGLDWGLGYFKPKACDWCDDIAGETADMSSGDAWLPEIIKDPNGNNIIVVRNSIINNILIDGKNSNSLKLDEVSAQKVYDSQAGNYRHRQEGLSLRIHDAKEKLIWAPEKRVSPNDYNIDKKRKKIYRLREKISEHSHHSFLLAKKRKSFSLFVLKMLPHELYYYFLNKRFFKGGLKVTYQYFCYLKNRFL